jgi:hypothetical protein
LSVRTLGGSRWSPDGKWIWYEQASSEGAVDVLAVEVANPTLPRRICSNVRTASWIDHERLAVLSVDLKTFIYSTDGSAPRPFFEDSTYARPILKGLYVFYRDFRKGHEGFWIAGLTSQGQPEGKPRKLPFEISPTSGWGSPDGRIWLYEKKPGELWRLTLPDWREEYVCPTGLIRFPFVSLDGKRFAYLVHNCTMKLTLIENLFE